MSAHTQQNMKSVIIGLVVLLLVGGGLYAMYNKYIKSDTATNVLTEELPIGVPEERTLGAIVVGTLGHDASGSAYVIRDAQKTFIRYEDFATVNGPDLFVYLSTDIQATEFVNLGALKSINGDQNYEVPQGTDIEKYHYVLVWCKQFGVLFNYADLLPLLNTQEMQAVDSEMNSTQEMSGSEEQEKTVVAQSDNNEAYALFGNGCFWCVEADLAKVNGVIDVVSGYAGGTSQNPTYETYSKDGHREVVLVTYNPQKVSYANLVEHIIKHGDPTDSQGSFGDRGLSYAPALYYQTLEEKRIAEVVIKQANALEVFEKPLTIAIIPKVQFYSAEEYHQDYAFKNPLRYSYYRNASGRSKFIEKHWSDSATTFTISNSLQAEVSSETPMKTFNSDSWNTFVKPAENILKAQLTPIQYKVTQEDGTEPSFRNEYDSNKDEGIYVDIVSGEPLFFSKDKYDSGTGWPSFVQPLSKDAVTLHEDKGFFTTRTEVRSVHADSHLGHVFDDGPTDRGGKRYCMNSAALRFIAKDAMEEEGYGYLVSQI